MPLAEHSIREALDGLKAYRAEAQAMPAPFEIAVRDELWRIGTMLIDKNRSYGNSAFDPVRIFSRAHPIDQILVRLDDKLSRFRHAQSWPGDDNIDDIIGYLILLRLAQSGAV